MHPSTRIPSRILAASGVSRLQVRGVTRIDAPVRSVAVAVDRLRDLQVRVHDLQLGGPFSHVAASPAIRDAELLLDESQADSHLRDRTLEELVAIVLALLEP